MADMTYINLPEIKQRAGRNAYPLVAAFDGFQGGLVGLEGGVLVKWGPDTATILFLGILLDYEGSGTGVDDSADPDNPKGRVNENGDELQDVAVTGVTAQTDVGALVFCGSDNWFTDLTLTPPVNAKAVGWLSGFIGTARGNVKMFTPEEYRNLA